MSSSILANKQLFELAASFFASRNVLDVEYVGLEPANLVGSPPWNHTTNTHEL